MPNLLTKLNTALGEAKIGIDQPGIANKALKELGFKKPRPGRTYEDLQDTLLPATDQARSKSTGEPRERWTEWEIINALAPIIRHDAKRYTSGSWTKQDRHSIDAFQEAVQNAALAVVNAIRRGEDKGKTGNAYTTWIRHRMLSAISGGVKQGPEIRSALGIIDKLERTAQPTVVQAQIDAVMNDPQSYGKRARDLVTASHNLMQAIQSKDKAQIANVKSQIHQLRQEIESDEPSILGARTGMHDVISTPHSDDKRIRFLKQLGNATSRDDIINIFHRAPSRDLSQKARELMGAFERANFSQVGEIKDEIQAEITQRGGGAEEFQSNVRRTGLEVKGEGGEMAPNPDLPGAPGDFLKEIQDKEVVNRLLTTALQGIEGPHGTIQLNPYELRILIRLYGLQDWPGKGTANDPEFDATKRQDIMQRLSNEEEVQVKPINRNEAGMLADLASRYDPDFDDPDPEEPYTQEDIEEYYDILMKQFSTEGVMDLENSHPEAAEQIATHLAFSPWVRAGSPEMDVGKIRKELGGPSGAQVSSARYSTIQRKMNDKLQKIGEMVRPHLGLDESFAHALFTLYDVAEAEQNRILLEDADIIDCELVGNAKRSIGRAILEYACYWAE